MLALETSRTVAGVPDQIVGNALRIQEIRQSGLTRIRVYRIEADCGCRPCHRITRCSWLWYSLLPICELFFLCLSLREYFSYDYLGNISVIAYIMKADYGRLEEKKLNCRVLRRDDNSTVCRKSGDGEWSQPRR